MTDWKVVLLFVPADSMCACSPDVRFLLYTKVMFNVAYVRVHKGSCNCFSVP